MSKIDSITAERLRELLDYDPETGLLTRRISIGSGKAGNLAGGFPRGLGYLGVTIDRKYYYIHRIAFLYMTGEMPDEVDHINHDRGDNRWSNLSAATRRTNSMNQSLRADNTSGIAGVVWNRRDQRWVAQTTINRRHKHLGCFTTKIAAAYAKHAAEVKHDFHPNHGQTKPRRLK